VGEDAGHTGRRGVDRLTVQEAARRLGISEGAIRKRVARRTIRHEKGQDGRVYVHLDAGVDAGQDEGVDPHNSALTSQLREEIAYLREENRRKDEIIMQQAITMKQLTAGAPPMPREAPQTTAEDAGGVEPRPATGEAQEGSERPWWRRLLWG
jgi:excisionase family DNA binding protein